MDGLYSGPWSFYEAATVSVSLVGRLFSCKPSVRYRDEAVVPIIVAYTGKSQRDRLKAAGGRWDPEEKHWRVRFGSIRGDNDLNSGDTIL